MKVFIEEQKFNQSLVYIGLSISLVVVVLAVLSKWEETIKSSLGEQFAASLGIIIVILVIILFLILKLQTKIDELGVQYKFYPFQRSFKTIKWNEISECYIRNYDPISDYGGWGIKSSFRKNTGKAITTKGTIGLQLKLKNGKKLLIGTQKKEALESVLKTYSHKITKNEL